MTPPHFFIFVIISRLKRTVLALDLYNFEFPLPKDDLYQVLLKLPCWFWRRRLLKIFSKFLPLGRMVVLHLYNSESPLPIRMICANFN
jgi:hypothetical protein